MIFETTNISIKNHLSKKLSEKYRMENKKLRIIAQLMLNRVNRNQEKTQFLQNDFSYTLVHEYT